MNAVAKGARDAALEGIQKCKALRVAAQDEIKLAFLAWFTSDMRDANWKFEGDVAVRHSPLGAFNDAVSAQCNISKIRAEEEIRAALPDLEQRLSDDEHAFRLTIDETLRTIFICVSPAPATLLVARTPEARATDRAGELARAPRRFGLPLPSFQKRPRPSDYSDSE